MMHLSAEIHRTGMPPEVRAVADRHALVADVIDEYIAHAGDVTTDPSTRPWPTSRPRC